MNLQNEKCVIVVDEELPLGIIANTGVILGITLGKTFTGNRPGGTGKSAGNRCQRNHA